MNSETGNMLYNNPTINTTTSSIPTYIYSDDHNPARYRTNDGGFIELPVSNTGCQTFECVYRCGPTRYESNKQWCDAILNTPSTNSMYSDRYGGVVSPVVPRT